MLKEILTDINEMLDEDTDPDSERAIFGACATEETLGGIHVIEHAALAEKEGVIQELRELLADAAPDKHDDDYHYWMVDKNYRHEVRDCGCLFDQCRKILTKLRAHQRSE